MIFTCSIYIEVTLFKTWHFNTLPQFYFEYENIQDLFWPLFKVLGSLLKELQKLKFISELNKNSEVHNLFPSFLGLFSIGIELKKNKKTTHHRNYISFLNQMFNFLVLGTQNWIFYNSANNNFSIWYSNIFCCVE